MPNNWTKWQEFLLDNFIDFNPSVQLRKGAQAKKVDMDKLAPYTRKITEYTKDIFKSGSKFSNGDTLLARITPCLENGKTAFVDILDNDEFAFGSTEFIVLRGKEGISDSLFIYYLARSPQFRDKAISFMTGTSGRQRVELTALKSLSFNLPPFDEQKRIAGVLGAFDDKIELLQKQNKTLEDMAKAIFKSWFVDFDIVKAKERGEEKQKIISEYKITEELYNLFPSSFTDAPASSSLGPIPTGWEVKQIKDIGNVIGGGTPSTKETSYFAEPKKGFAWITPKDLSGYAFKYISNGEKDITTTGLKNSSAKIMPENSVLFSSRAPIGYIAISLNEISTNQGFKSIVPNEPFFAEYIYQYLLFYKSYLEGLASGSTFKEISGSVMKAVNLLIPDKSILVLFEKNANILNTKLKNNQKQIQTLTELRDGLLPRLLSGKLQV